MTHETNGTFLNISTSSIEITPVMPVIMKLLSLSNTLALYFPAQPQEVVLLIFINEAHNTKCY